MRLSTSLRLNAQKGLVTPYDPALTLDLQFAARQSYVANIGPLPTFTNATGTARTYVGSDGLLKTAAINVPRIEFDPVTRLCRGLLIEEQRQNLSTWSEDVTNVAWAKTNVTATANQTTAPDGLVTADLVSETTTNSQHYIRPVLASITTGVVYTGSVFLKKGSGATAPDWVIITFPFAGFGTQNVAFNVTTGSFGTVSGSLTYSAQQFSSGWWRVIVTSTCISTGSNGCIFVAFNNNTNTVSIPAYAGQTTSDIFVWGAQFEAGTFASSYIPTTTASLVRSADVCSITGAAFTGFYNQTEGTIAIKMDKASVVAAASTQLNYVSINDGTLNNYVLLCQRAVSPIGEVFRVEDTGAGQANISAGALISAGTDFSLAGAYKLNDFATSLNGAASVTDTTGTVPLAVNQLQFNTVLNSYHIKSLKYFNVRKTNAQLQALSTP